MSNSGSGHLLKTAGINPVDANAALWLARREHESWNDADQAALDAWLSEASLHKVTYLRLRDAWTRADRLAALRGPGGAQKAHEVHKQKGLTTIRIAIICVAAVALASAAGLYLYISYPRDTTYATPIGGREVVALFDGSQVELNTDTVIRVSANTQNRFVTLEKGEAYFQVRHDAQHPFVVDAFGHRVTDLGTEFVVRGDANRIEVALVEGRARIDSTSNVAAHSVILAPGDVATATGASIAVTKKQETSLADQLAWRQGLLIFDNTTLSDVAAEFNRYNKRKVIIADAATARLSIMGKFPVNDVSLFGRVAKAVLGVRVEARDDEIVISR